MNDHPRVTQVETLATELLDEARRNQAHRAARTLVNGMAQRATLIALAKDAEMAEHGSPTAGTLHVLAGQVRLHTHDQEWVLDKGSLANLPPQRHGLRALADSVVLLTIALR
ncbi:cupin domain-containing protein [Actinophytocola sediminis]